MSREIPMRTPLTLLAAAAAFCTTAMAWGWDAPTHRLITQLAVERFHERAGTPVFFGDGDIQAQVADGSTVPDRWRASRTAQLTHVNNPDHYIDIESLAPYNIKFQDLPPLRHEFIKALVTAKIAAGPDFKGRPSDPAKDFAKTDEWPGFLPYTILEHYGKLRADFYTYRILEKINDPRRGDQLKAAKMQIIVEMGQLSHFVGDAAQPLHTTVHHHGWVGENPNNYTTDRKFHAHIDGEVPKLQKFTIEKLREAMPPAVEIDAADPWKEVNLYIWRSHEYVEELYRMHKTGDLEGMQGGRLIGERIMDAGAELAALYTAAWEASAPTDKDVEDFARYDNFVTEPAAPAAPAPAPAPVNPGK